MIIRNNYAHTYTQKTQKTVNKDEGKHFCQDCYHRHLLMGGQDKDTDLVIQMAASKVSVTCDCDCHNKAADLAEPLKNALDKAKEENSFFNKDNWFDEMKNKAQDKAKNLAEQLNSEENKKNEQQKDENQYVIPNELRPKIDRNNKTLFLR